MAEVQTRGGVSPMMYLFGVAAIVLAILYGTGKLEEMAPLSETESTQMRYAEAQALNAEVRSSMGGLDSIGADREAMRHQEEARRIRDRKN